MSMTFDDKEDKEFLRLLELMDEGFKLFTVAMPVNFVPLFRYIPGVNYAYQKIKGNRSETSEFFRKIADEHRASLDRDNIRDIVDAYLVRQEKASADQEKETYFSEAQLLQIMNDLFSAGLETVTSTIEWAVLFLMKHQDVQERLYSEVQAVIGSERSPELDDLTNMPYTEATIYEVLRRSNVIALGNAHAALQSVPDSLSLIGRSTHRLSLASGMPHSPATSSRRTRTSSPTSMPSTWTRSSGRDLTSSTRRASCATAAPSNPTSSSPSPSVSVPLPSSPSPDLLFHRSPYVSR